MGILELAWPIWLAMAAAFLVAATLYSYVGSRHQVSSSSKSRSALGEGFWWYFAPLFLAFTAPPVGIAASLFALSKGPIFVRTWSIISLVISIFLSVLGATILLR